MRKQLITSVIGLSMLTLTVTACGTLTGAAVGARGEARRSVTVRDMAPARARSSVRGLERRQVRSMTSTI